MSVAKALVARRSRTTGLVPVIEGCPARTCVVARDRIRALLLRIFPELLAQMECRTIVESTHVRPRSPRRKVSPGGRRTVLTPDRSSAHPTALNIPAHFSNKRKASTLNVGDRLLVSCFEPNRPAFCVVSMMHPRSEAADER